MQLNILVRGQSNAYYFDQLGGSAILKYALEHTLGFDGVRDRVNLVGTSVPDPAGNTTIYGGTSLLPTPSGGPHWLDVVGTDGVGTGTAATLSAGLLEQGLLAHVVALPADVRAAPTAVIWLHNEGDANWTGQTQAAWTRAVRYDAGLVRAALGQTAATVPYLFTDVIPFDADDAASMQAIKAGMESLAADPSFNGAIGTRTGDLDMDNPANGLAPGRVIFGGPHVDRTDVAVLARRISRTLIDSFARCARPGSPLALAGGRLDDAGPQAVSATVVEGSPTQLVVGLTPDPASSGLAALGAGAAAGLGWSVRSGGGSLAASAAAALPGGRLLLSFGAPVPADGTATLHYGYGTGRIAAGAASHSGAGYPGEGAGAPGRANAIYDDQGMTVWTAAAGVPAGAGARPLALDGDAGDYRIAAVPGGMMLVRDVRPGAGSDLVLQDTTVLGFRNGPRLFEPTGTLSDVARLYRTALARPPDQVSAVAFRDGSTDIGHLAEYMPASPEFITRAGPLDDAAFVRMLYVNGLGRAPEAAGANGWAALLYAGASRGAVLRGVADSVEARINQAPGAGGGLLAEAVRLYGATLGGASPKQLASAVGFLAGGGTAAALAASVGASAEFAAAHGRQDASAFVDSVYLSALGRPTQGDAGGWVAALDAGAARPQIALAIADSVEGRLYTSAATHLGLVALV